MSTLAHLEQAVSRLTPLSLAETSWDNVGLLVEPPKPRSLAAGEKRRVYLCIDLTRPVVDEALSDPSTTAILTYHPPIFSGLKRLTLASALSQSLLECVAEGVAVYTVHTAADVAVNGTNDWMATGLLTYAAAGAADVSCDDQRDLVRPGGLATRPRGVRALKENSNPPEGHEGCGMGRIVNLGEVGLARDDMIKAVKQTLALEHFQAAWAPSGPEHIRTIAICAGSGSSVLKGVEADLYLTGEMGHHDILAANAKGIHVFCCNHTATERPWLSYFAPRLQRELNRLASTTHESSAAAAGGERSEYEVVVSRTDREPLEVV
ncbi:hypothetical protein JCM11491_004160 [Sporobolomyces phaffii]